MSDTGRTAAEDIRYAAALLQFISEGKRVLPSELRAAARRLRKIAQVYWGTKTLQRGMVGPRKKP